MRDDVGDGPGTDCDWATCGHATDEPESNQAAHIVRQSAGNVEEEEEEIARVVGDVSPVELRGWGNDERPYRVAENVDGCDKRPEGFVGRAELLHEVATAGRHHGRC